MAQLMKDIAVKQSIEAIYTGGSVIWSANGKKLFSTCTNVVKVIDLDDNNKSYTIGDVEDELKITCLCLDKNRNRLLVAFNNNVIREYIIPLENGEKPELARTWKTMHSAPILVMEFNEEGILLATGSADRIVKVWNLNEQQCTHTLKGPSVVSAIVFGKNDKLVVGYIEGQINLYNIMRGATEKLVKEWKNHNSQITSLVQIPDSLVVVALSRDQTMSLHETETQETLKVLPLFESIEAAVIGHDGYLYTVGEEGFLKKFHIESAKLVQKKRISSVLLNQLNYDPICNRFLAVSAEENLFVINFTNMIIERQIVGFHDEIYSCCFLGKNESHLVVASNTNEIRVYNSETLDCQLIRGHTESVLSVATPKWNPNLLASCSKDNSILFWKLHDKNDKWTISPIAIATGHGNSVTSIAFSNTAKFPFITSVSSDCMLKLWALKDIEKFKTNEAEDEESIENLPKISCGSTMVAHGKEVNCVDVSESDNVIATGGMDKLVKIWQVDGVKVQLGIGGTLSGHRRGVGDVKFAKNSHRLASCSGDMTIKIWNVGEKTCLQTISGHSCAVFRILFVSNDAQILSADSAGILKIWTVKNSECETTIEGHNDKIWSLIPNSKENEFVTSGSDGKIIIWKDVTEEKQLVEDEKRREKIEQEQTLSNLLDQNRYQEALEFALGLVRPFCALKVVNILIENETLGEALSRLDERKIRIIMDFATQWNTNSRTSQAAQRVLFEILLIVPPEELLEMPNCRSFVESYLPYTKRHMDRLDRARQDASLLEFIWKQMRIAS